MAGNLDVGPLRSLVAIADHGGFQRAADHLHLTQSAVSQHIRRLETVGGRPLVERKGRGSRFTPAGERLLAQARRLLALHDDMLCELHADARDRLVVGVTEHAAAQLLPALSSGLADIARGHELRFRVDRGARLDLALASGTVDLGLLFTATETVEATPVGELELRWYSSPDWLLPDGGAPVPIVAFDEPCALRRRALEVLAAHGHDAVVGAEAPQLAGVQAAVGAGLGVALMASLGPDPEGLLRRTDLPEPEPLTVFLCARPGLPRNILRAAADAVSPLLTATRTPTPA